MCTEYGTTQWPSIILNTVQMEERAALAWKKRKGKTKETLIVGFNSGKSSNQHKQKIKIGKYACVRRTEHNLHLGRSSDFPLDEFNCTYIVLRTEYSETQELVFQFQIIETGDPWIHTQSPLIQLHLWSDAWTAGPPKAVSEGHLSAGDPPPRLPRVPPSSSKVIVHGCISQEKEPMVYRGLGGLPDLRSQGFGVQFMT